jgi:TetR/AcrR family transcriptional regulator, cholesterol catabolism regulator
MNSKTRKPSNPVGNTPSDPTTKAKARRTAGREKPGNVVTPPVAKKSTSHIGKRRDLAIEKGSASYQERRNEIARVAANLFNQKGFQGTSITAVAEALEMDRATLYYYISNKQELFDEVVREASEKNVAAAEEARSSDAAPLDKLRTLVVDLMNSYASNYPLLYVYIRENLTHVDAERTDWSKYMRNLNRRYEEAVIAIVQEGIDNGTIRPLASARVLAFGVIGMIGWTNRWFVPDRSPESSETIGKAYAEVIVAGLAT